MQEEIESLRSNHTWEDVTLQEGRIAIGSKWAFKLKRDAESENFRFKARIVTQGVSQKFGVDYDKVFAPVATHTLKPHY